MKRTISLTTCWLAVIACIPFTANAQTPGQDSATGTGGTASYTDFAFDVTGGPSGENPTGALFSTSRDCSTERPARLAAWR